PPTTSLMVVGGHFENQRELLRWALRPGRTIAVGGPLAATLLVASGENLGRTEVETALLAEARTWLELAQRSQTNVVLPNDFIVVGEHLKDDSVVRPARGLELHERAVDLGPYSVETIGNLAKECAAVLMMNDLSLARRQTSSLDVQRLVAATQAFCVAVHGGLDARISAADLPSTANRFVSTAGDTFIDAICGRKIAGVERLRTVG